MGRELCKYAHYSLRSFVIVFFFFSHLSSRCVSINIYNKFIISHTHHIQYYAKQNTVCIILCTVCMTDNKFIIFVIVVYI